MMLKLGLGQRGFRTGLFAVLALTANAVGHAALMRYEYGGTITSADPSTGITPGSRFSGTFTYDPAGSPSAMMIEGQTTSYYGLLSFPPARRPMDPASPSRSATSLSCRIRGECPSPYPSSNTPGNGVTATPMAPGPGRQQPSQSATSVRRMDLFLAWSWPIPRALLFNHSHLRPRSISPISRWHR